MAGADMFMVGLLIGFVVGVLVGAGVAGWQLARERRARGGWSTPDAPGRR